MKNMVKKNKTKIYSLGAFLLLIFADQFTKLLAADRLKGKPDYPLIPHILEFSYLENRGAAFNSFMGKQGFLIVLTACVMLFLIFKFFQTPDNRRFLPMQTAFVLIVSGGIGNLIDRILNGYVIDFIYFVPINFPKFNAADCYVTIGMILLCFVCFFYYKDEELNFLFSLKR